MELLERPGTDRRYIREATAEEPVVVESEENADGTVEFSGYLLRWGDVAEIKDMFGSYNETFERGAFTKTFSERGPSGNKDIKMLKHHDQRSTAPGKFTDLHEDDTGAAFSAKTILTDAGKNLAVEIREGVINAMSIGFNVPKGGDVYDKERNLFTVTRAKVLEASPVFFPAYQSASIDQFRSLDDMLPHFNRLMVRMELGEGLTPQQIGQLVSLRARMATLLDGPDDVPPVAEENLIDTLEFRTQECEEPVNDHSNDALARLRLYDY